MKACIVTFQSADNYGAVLQAYALQEYLCSHGIETRILDYHNERIDASYSSPRFCDFLSNPKRATFKTIQSILFRTKKKKIDEFRNRFLNLTSRYDKSNIHSASTEADIFITGSDQVWNYLITGKDSTYFLDFAQNKLRISYAASFGISQIPEKYEEYYREGLKNLSDISVREQNGVELVHELATQKAVLVPDPTLLLGKEEWRKHCLSPIVQEKYILVYKITKADQLLGFAKKIARMTDLPIVYIPNDIKDGLVGRLKSDVGPKEWLGYINHAEYVITNSFHGTIFSILFGKKFFAEVSNKVNPSTSRLNTLLQTFGLESRRIDQFSDEILTEEIDQSLINDVLSQKQNDAELFFKDVFQTQIAFDII